MGNRSFWARRHQADINADRRRGCGYHYAKPQAFDGLTEEQARRIWEWHCGEMFALDNEHQANGRRKVAVSWLIAAVVAVAYLLWPHLFG